MARCCMLLKIKAYLPVYRAAEEAGTAPSNFWRALIPSISVTVTNRWTVCTKSALSLHVVATSAAGEEALLLSEHLIEA